MKKRRRLLGPPLNGYRDKNKRKRLPQKKGEGHELRRIWQRDARCRLEKEGARQQDEYNHECRASGACPDPITDPLGWCECEWSRKGTYETGLGTYGAPVPWTINN